jgi:hypothetical protein
MKAKPGGGHTCHEMLALPIRSEELDYGKSSSFCTLAKMLHCFLDRSRLRRGKIRLPIPEAQRDENATQPVVQVIQALDETHYSLICSKGTGGERLGRSLVNLQKLPVTKRSMRRERIPGWIIKEYKPQGEGWIGPCHIVLSPGA